MKRIPWQNTDLSAVWPPDSPDRIPPEQIEAAAGEIENPDYYEQSERAVIARMREG